MNLFRFSALSVLLLSVSACFKERRSDKAGEKMQQFVMDISSYARGIDPSFIIIPLNGPELFFNGTYSLDSERLDMFEELVKNCLSSSPTALTQEEVRRLQ